MIPPRFDRLAPHYAWIEAITFGRTLQWCRTAHLSELTDARRVLILGEGDGRFVSAFLATNARAVVDVVDASATMIALARHRVGHTDRVQWHLADARQFEPPSPSYDLIVTNFFLDCFPAAELAPLMARLAERLAPNGRWLVGDFALPSGRVRRWLARCALTTMYLCFTLVTRIPASTLTDPRPHLRSNNLTTERELRRLGGFVVATLWRKSESADPIG